jgi:hypothetical protein
MNKDDLQLIFSHRDERLVLHYMLLTRQMTKLSDCLLHIIRLQTQKNGKHKGVDYKGYRSYAQSELSDVLLQTKKLCDILGLDFIETYLMGIKRDEEKKKEYLESHPEDVWI